MARSIIALYNDLTTARRVVESLVDAGVDRGEISLVSNDASGKYATYINTPREDEDVHTDEGAGFGAVVGAMVGLGAMLIPGVGPVIAAGPLVAALVGAGVGAAAGAVTGGITASLVDLGIDNETAGYYAEGIRRGGTLVIAHVSDSWEDRVREIMNRHNPIDIKGRADEWRASGWTGFDESVDRLTEKPHSFDDYETKFRRHYSSAYSNTGYNYDYYLPAYQYGYRLANDARYSDYDWTRLESEARLRWEERNQGTWEQVKDAVRNAWESVREAVS